MGRVSDRVQARRLIWAANNARMSTMKAPNESRHTDPSLQQVLVLCTGNSCRSVMAEAMINQLGAGRYVAVSAGSQPAGYVHPKSLQTLERHGITPGPTRSKSWDEFRQQAFDLVITVCDRAASEVCPTFPGQYRKLHWSTPDPAAATGSDAAIDAAFDAAFLMLKGRIEKELL